MLMVVLVGFVPRLAVAKVDPIQDACVFQRGHRPEDGGEVGAGHMVAHPGMEVVK